MIALAFIKFTTYQNTARGKAVSGKSVWGELLSGLKAKSTYYSLESTR